MFEAMDSGKPPCPSTEGSKRLPDLLDANGKAPALWEGTRPAYSSTLGHQLWDGCCKFRPKDPVDHPHIKGVTVGSVGHGVVGFEQCKGRQPLPFWYPRRPNSYFFAGNGDFLHAKWFFGVNNC